MNELGKLLVLLGVILVVLGTVLWATGRIPLIGRLPGDIVIRRENFTLYLPIATSILLSLLLTLILFLLRK